MNIKMYVISGVMSHPCKIRTMILVASHPDLGRNPGGINSGKILAAGILIPSGWISSRFLPGRRISGSQNISRILPWFSPRFLSRSNPAANLPKILTGSKNLGGKNLAVILPGNSPRFPPRSKFPATKIFAWSCREYCQNLRQEVEIFLGF